MQSKDNPASPALQHASGELKERLQAEALRLESVPKIDAALARYRLTEAERACLIALRRRAARAEHVGKRTRSGRFIADTMAKTGLSQATIYRDLRRADELGLELLRQIIGTTFDQGSQLDRLMKVPAADRIRKVQQARSKAPK